MNIPANGTRAAVTYWTRRTRESLRWSEQALDTGQLSHATELAMQAAGEASEREQAVIAYREAKER